MTHTLILLELIQVYTVRTTYITNLKYKCNFVTYINFHASFIITKFKMNSYETIVSANRMWDIHCVRGLSQDSTDHTGGIQLIFLPLGRPELQHFCYETKICIVLKHFQKKRFYNLPLTVS